MWSTGISVKLHMENSQRDNMCLNTSRDSDAQASLSLFSVWLVLSVLVISQEFPSVVKDDSSSHLMWAYKLLIDLTVCLNAVEFNSHFLF